MTDIEVIKVIEEELGVQISQRKRNELNKWVNGYSLNQNGNVIGLNLHNCDISEIVVDFIVKLRLLESLVLDRNSIVDISFIEELVNLKKLDLNNNEISDISLVEGLNRLEYLDFGNNTITELYPLENLFRLKELNLSSNKIQDIASLKFLSDLEFLNIEVNQIVDVSPLSHLNSLSELVIGYNDIHDATPLGNLTGLQSLWIENTNVSDISFIKNLSQLEKLILLENPIEILPSYIAEMNMEIQWEEYGTDDGYISFYNNPLKSPPPEIVKQGKKAIKNYFKSLEGNKTVKLKETKVLLVGEGMAGKTSLLKKFQGLEFNQDESQTHGINVVSVPAQKINGFAEENLADHQIHFWDFGGQEIMHASHQFFLSKRSLYILILDSRTDSKKYHWLKHIEKFGGDSPVIVVMNKIDDNPGYNIEQKKINEAFSQVDNRFFRLSCHTGEGYQELIRSLEKTIPQTSLYGTEISVDWMNIKEALVAATQADRYIDRDAFVAICKQNNVSDESSQQTLLQYLNDLGVVLYFKQLSLSNIYVLDPHWVTIGVYKILASEKVKKGILYEADLDFILNKEKTKKREYDPAKDKKIKYSLEEQRYILSIMEQFELCYLYDKNQSFYIVPDLLPKELENEPELTEGILLRFVMEYDYLPSAILSRLMLRLKEDIVENQQWKYGMMLDNSAFGCQAKIKADETTKRIEIIVQGKQLKKQRYFSAIRHNILSINREFENLVVKEFIPLPEHQEYLIEYSELLGYERANKDEYFVGKLGKSFSVSEMLDSVISKHERTQHMGDINIDLSNIGNPQQTVNQKVQQEVSQQQTVTQEVKMVQGLFKNLKEDLFEEIEMEIDDEKDQRRIKHELQKTEKAFSELEQAAAEGKQEVEESTKDRIGEFIDNLSDQDSRLNKALKFVSKGSEKLQKLGKVYNNVAPFFMLPSIPPVLLGKE
jgi:internalin A